MKQIKVGCDFSCYGQIIRLVAVEKTTAVLKDLKTDKVFTYGVEALRRVTRNAGYDLMV